MANIEMLRNAISKSGLTITSLSEKTGILRETFYNRFNKPDFKASEIESLTKVLKLTKKERDEIFFSG